jgi:DNA-binding MarR family transcriptional regulator
MQSHDDKSGNPYSKPGHLINRAARLFVRVGEHRLRTLGIAVAQLPVLRALAESPAMTQRQLAEYARIEQPSMAQLLARMERDGLIRRRADPDDGRRSLITLTARARRRLPQLRGVLLQGNGEAVAGMSKAEVATLTRLMERVIANLEAAAAGHSRRARTVKGLDETSALP